MSQTLPRALSARRVESNGHVRNGGANRPSSLYDSTGGRLESAHESPREYQTSNLERTPSMANSLSTTVPVNLKVQPLAGRHTPTRHSLRHSRMIVLNRTPKLQRQWTPPVVRLYRFTACLACCQLALGFLLLALSSGLLLWAPGLPCRSNPHYSGATLVLAGLVGCVFLFCYKHSFTSSTFSTAGGDYLKVLCFLVSGVAAVCCICAGVFAGIQTIHVGEMNCRPNRPENDTCVCQNPPTDGASLENLCDCNISSSIDVSSVGPDCNSYCNASTTEPTVYTNHKCKCEHLTRDSSSVGQRCEEVKTFLPILLICSSVTNALAVVVVCWYLLLLWRARSHTVYTGVRTTYSDYRS